MNLLWKILVALTPHQLKAFRVHIPRKICPNKHPRLDFGVKGTFRFSMGAALNSCKRKKPNYFYLEPREHIIAGFKNDVPDYTQKKNSPRVCGFTCPGIPGVFTLRPANSLCFAMEKPVDCWAWLWLQNSKSSKCSHSFLWLILHRDSWCYHCLCDNSFDWVSLPWWSILLVSPGLVVD